MPLFKKTEKAVTKAVLQSAATKIGSGAKLPDLNDLRVFKKTFADSCTVEMSEVTTPNVKKLYREVGELQGFNIKLGVLLKGKQMQRQEALKTITLALQDKAGVIRSEGQLQQTMSRYGSSNAGTVLQMDAGLAQFDGLEVHLEPELDTLLKGWNG
jgi:hypothetical protein